MAILPFYAAHPVDSATAPRVLFKLGPRLFTARWQQPALRGAAAATMTGTTGANSAVAVLTWATASGVSAGYAYAALDPANRFHQDVGTFARILQSFAVHGSPVQSPPALQYDVFRDPAQAAFTVEVPRGWPVVGGTKQVSFALTQASVTATSPDRAILLLLGDTAPQYVVPDAYQATAGIHVGDTYTDTSGTRVTVEPYDPGTKWVIDYFLPRIPGVRVVSNTSVPNLASRLLGGIGVRYDAGVLQFTFPRKGRTYRGGAVCITERDATTAFTDWHVWRLYLWEAPPSRFAEATAAEVNMAKTFAIDADWARRRGQAVVQQSQIIAQEGEAVSNTVQSSFQYRQSVEDQISAREENAVLGTSDVFDPETQQTFRVDDYSTYNWIDPQGNIVGTRTNTAPGVNFRQLLSLNQP